MHLIAVFFSDFSILIQRLGRDFSQFTNRQFGVIELLNQLTNTLGIVKTRHIIKAFINPVKTLQAFKYHYRRVSELSFVTFMGTRGGSNIDEIEKAYHDLLKNTSTWRRIDEKLSVYPDSYGLQMTRELPVLYLSIRLRRPEYVVETGVSSGASSAYILQALRDNQKGILHSIDLPPDNLPKGQISGWIVPSRLRKRWVLHIGDSKELLKPLLNGLPKIDCFIHDSLHTYSHMLWEFNTVWEHLTDNGLFLSHDVGANKAFLDFIKAKRISWKNYRIFHVLGGFHKIPH